MHNYTQTGSSEVSVEQAVNEAIEHVVEANGMHHDMFVVVDSVHHINGGYQVEIRASTINEDERGHLIEAAHSIKDPMLLSMIYGGNIEKVEEIISDERNKKRLIHDAEIDFFLATHNYKTPVVNKSDIPKILKAVGYKKMCAILEMNNLHI